MNFDDQMHRYFGSIDPGEITIATLASGMEQLAVDFGLETDSGRRFAMWSLMYMLGNAPDLDVAFKDAKDRDAARDFMDMIARTDGQ